MFEPSRRTSIFELEFEPEEIVEDYFEDERETEYLENHEDDPWIDLGGEG